VSADLHTHTRASDGALAPSELVRRAAALGVQFLSVTDHDSVNGLADALAAAPPEMTVIPGVELTCHAGGREAHVLAYGVGIDDPPFRALLGELAGQREERARRMVDRLLGLGVEVEYADVERIAAGATVTRPHVARALVERGHVGSLDEAFARFIGRSGPAHVPKPHREPRGTFEAVRRAGGVPVLAHPGTFRRDDLIPGLVEDGLEGLEVRHTEHSAAATRHYEALARDLGLLPTGGSDFHGTPGHRSRIGRPRVPAEWALNLVDRIQGRG
jgi:3',5'-nucleoside bisphosphate phosphatase